jgi:hypothetical protein
MLMALQITLLSSQCLVLAWKHSAACLLEDLIDWAALKVMMMPLCLTGIERNEQEVSPPLTRLT